MGFILYTFLLSSTRAFCGAFGGDGGATAVFALIFTAGGAAEFEFVADCGEGVAIAIVKTGAVAGEDAKGGAGVAELGAGEDDFVRQTAMFGAVVVDDLAEVAVGEFAVVDQGGPVVAADGGGVAVELVEVSVIGESFSEWTSSEDEGAALEGAGVGELKANEGLPRVLASEVFEASGGE